MLKHVRNNQGALAGDPSPSPGREWLVTLGPAVLLVIAAILLAMRFMPPPPPKEVNITTGVQGGGYHGFGVRYAEILARSGVRLNVLPSGGSIENLERLKTQRSGVSIGLLQGGIGNAQQAPELLSVGRMFYEPMWVFFRGAAVTRLSELEGKRVAVGAPGSGTRALADELLKASSINSRNATLLPLSGQPAADALKNGDVDAAFFTLAPQAPIIQDLMRAKDIRVMSFAQADALVKLFPYLARLTLPQGVFDLSANVPDRDITLVAPQAALVAHNTLHPAIIALLAEAAQEVHGKTSLLAKANEFPTHSDPEFDMDPDALRFYKSGPTFWKRVLPYWLANMVERTLVFLVPLLTVLIPLVKFAPLAYRWRFRRRLLHWYGRLKEVEGRVGQLPRDNSAEAGALHSELDHIDLSVSRVSVPIQFAEQFYNLREHLDLVRERLKSRIA